MDTIQEFSYLCAYESTVAALENAGGVGGAIHGAITKFIEFLKTCARKIADIVHALLNRFRRGSTLYLTNNAIKAIDGIMDIIRDDIDYVTKVSDTVTTKFSQSMTDEEVREIRNDFDSRRNPAGDLEATFTMFKHVIHGSDNNVLSDGPYVKYNTDKIWNELGASQRKMRDAQSKLNQFKVNENDWSSFGSLQRLMVLGVNAAMKDLATASQYIDEILDSARKEAYRPDIFMYK